MSVQILADQYLKYLDELLPKEAELTRFDPAKGLPDNVTRYDALLIRTVTPINPPTLPEAGNLQFIGTATAGTDHVDREHLTRLGIEFSQSEGCNANAVAEYVLTVLYRWAEKTSTDLMKKSVGIVGCGHTGGAVIRLLKNLGITYLAYDPPKAKIDPNFSSVSVDELLTSDILTFHTPLTMIGNNPTNHLGGREWLQHGFELIVNASRGGVIDEAALHDLHQQKVIHNYVLDVWEDEPNFRDRIAKKAFIATPHIAGYSVESKFRASKIVLSRLLNFFNLDINPKAEPERFEPGEFTFNPEFSFSELLWQNNQINYYDSELRKLLGLPSNIKSRRFAELRSKTALRHEYRTMITGMKLEHDLPKEFQAFE
ncbi:4-phosphoerythronate dehydrogenase [Rhodohalobacter halophilus]|uniref:4-phosphoerythronate dehydrogenase n=1 Tax=Rhodohalobacter halophilus TaxID=1812810 RepID=UPI00083F5514|nr:4-phosphoerythronate dehydrogenase [Rhodohalobacter halophilus]